MPTTNRKTTSQKSATARAKRAAANGATDGLTDAKAAVTQAVPAVKKVASEAAYATAYTVAYSVSFSVAFVGHLMPRRGSIGVGISAGRADGATQASRLSSVFFSKSKSPSDDQAKSIAERIIRRREKKKREAAVRVAAARAKGETFLTAANISHDAILTD